MMKFALTLIGFMTASAALAQTTIVGSGYLTPLHNGSEITFQQVIVPKWGEGQLIGSPRDPAKLLQLVKYSGSWRVGQFSGKMGPYCEYSTSTSRLASLGMYNFLRGKAFGGKIAGPLFLGFKPSGSPLEFNAPNTRILWPVAKAWSLGLGGAVSARSGKATVLQVGPMADWHRGSNTVWLRLGQMLTGQLRGNHQLRLEMYHTF